jgi:hypothetical protein
VSEAKGALIAVCIVLVLAYGFLRVAANWSQRGNEPSACQLMGGHWGFWDGWRCY